jgi:hypothetical protein
MSDRCDICGMAALESQKFAEERIPFRKPRRYCPACHRRFHYQIFAGFALFYLLLAAFGTVYSLRRHTPLLASPAVWFGLLGILQWALILPHELGHAVAGRALGFTQIRILVGGGRPIFSFNLLGFPVLINLVPFGGFTLSKPATERHVRWKLLVFIAAGPLVNVLLGAVAWQFIPEGSLLEGPVTMTKLFFWANLTLLAENLFPYVAQTPLGSAMTDGLLLWNMLFRWNKPAGAQPSRVPAWELAIRHLLKWVLVLILVVGTVFFLVVAAIPFVKWTSDIGWAVIILLPTLMLSLAAVSGYMAFRVARDPVARTRSPMPLGWTPPLSAEQMRLLREAALRSNDKDFEKAEALIDRALASMSDAKARAYTAVLLAKLQSVLGRGDAERAEELCLDAVNRTESKEQKIMILDGMASYIIYRREPVCLDIAERFARFALELAPGTLTLKGTLGGVLAEQGKFAEAEPLLQECLDRSPAVHDQGISYLYLGIVKLCTGKPEEGKRLLKRATVLFPEPWLVVKAKARLGAEE